MPRNRSRAGQQVALAGVLTAVLLTGGCTSSGSAVPDDGGRTGASASTSASASATTPSSPAIGEQEQPGTAEAATALFAAVPGGSAKAPAFDPDLVTDLDAALRKVMSRSSPAGFFAEVETGRPRGVMAHQYLLCPRSYGEDCRATLASYRDLIGACTGGVRVERTVGSGERWAAAGVCVRKMTAAMTEDAVAAVYGSYREAGAKVSTDPAFVDLARDWAAQRVSEPNESIQRIDTSAEKQLFRRLNRLVRGTGSCWARFLTAPPGQVKDPQLTFLPDSGAAALRGRRVRVGAGAVPGNGVMHLVFCMDVR